MFGSSGPFKQIDCPEGAHCQLLNCIFRHQPSIAITSRESLKDKGDRTGVQNAPTVTGAEPSRPSDQDETEDIPPPRKRSRRSASTEPSAVGARSDSSSNPTSSPEAREYVRDGDHEKTSQHHDSKADLEKSRLRPTPTTSLDHQLRTQKKSVSPPALKQEAQSKNTKDATSTQPSIIVPLKRKHETLKSETLAPRSVPRPPTAHGIRVKLLGLLHAQLTRLDQLVRASDDSWKEALLMSPQELIKAALDEEERAARSNASVYANVLKLRVTALKKMKLEAWRAERVKQLEKEFPELRKPAAPVRLETGLTEQEEISMLPVLVSAQDGLGAHGYVTEDIDAAQLEEARKGIESAHGHEVCDRCSTRFQVFPGRRDDGVLTTGGECTYHPGRARRPPKEKGRAGESERYTCCLDTLGSTGCAKAKHHVFKTSSPKRLALVLPFQRTPASAAKQPGSAVCFDCEMGYTTAGMELIRLTATAWPSERELIDVLVRPVGEVLDLNSAFSGVWPEQFTAALPFGTDGTVESTPAAMHIVESPAAARELLFQHIDASTPLIGHALENDLNAVRIIHPTIIDTVLLYPHPRGLPIRHGLKWLAKTHLNKDIQMGGAQGHDSKEDAIAAGELVRLRVKERWRKLVGEGWTVMDGEFIPPKPKAKRVRSE